VRWQKSDSNLVVITFRTSQSIAFRDERTENNWSLCVPSVGAADANTAVRAALHVQSILRRNRNAGMTEGPSWAVWTASGWQGFSPRVQCWSVRPWMMRRDRVAALPLLATFTHLNSNLPAGIKIEHHYFRAGPACANPSVHESWRPNLRETQFRQFGQQSCCRLSNAAS
jgi:hypothetical protein